MGIIKDFCKEFWDEHKDTIKNVTIAISVPLAVVAIYNIKRINGIIKENELNELFYGDEELNLEEDLVELEAIEADEEA